VAGHGHSVDEYLEVIYFLAFPIGEYRPAGESAIASRVAEMRGISRASAGELLKRLGAAPLGRKPRPVTTPAHNLNSHHTGSPLRRACLRPLGMT